MLQLLPLLRRHRQFVNLKSIGKMMLSEDRLRMTIGQNLMTTERLEIMLRLWKVDVGSGDLDRRTCALHLADEVAQIDEKLIERWTELNNWMPALEHRCVPVMHTDIQVNILDI